MNSIISEINFKTIIEGDFIYCFIMGNRRPYIGIVIEKTVDYLVLDCYPDIRFFESNTFEILIDRDCDLGI